MREAARALNKELEDKNKELKDQQDLGYELVEVEFAPGPGGGTLRFYIDKLHPVDGGIDAEDCAKASHGLLDSIEE